jgi:hypothetical protein
MPRKRPDVTDDTKYGARVLKLLPECKGFDVWELQIKLLAWGSGADNDGIGNFMDPVHVTGTFDITTRDAVKRLQKAYQLPMTGVVDDATFRAIDKQAALFPVMVNDLRCPCATRTDDPPILCQCMTDHPEKGKCTGFGKKKFDGKFLLDGVKLADDTDLSSEKLDLYDMKEYDGVDKAVLWAVRGLMKRAAVKRISVVAGYRCWHDNYLHTDNRRWRHRRITLNLGKAIEFQHGGVCAAHGEEIEYRYSDTGERNEIGKDWETKAECAECAKIRKVALEKCGFQSRWQEPDRVSVAEADKKARPPVTPFSVHIDTVRRLGREEDDFVKTYFDSVQPVYGKGIGASFPIDLGSGLDPLTASAEDFFQNTENSGGGWFPMGASRMWHGGVHLYKAAGTDVCAIAPGEVIACRVGEAEDANAYGSRNFVLLRHEWKTKQWYSLYMHLDAGKAEAASTIGWRKSLSGMTFDGVEAMVPMPLFVKKAMTELKADGSTVSKDRLIAEEGLAAGEWVGIEGSEIDPLTLDDLAPKDSTVYKVAGKVETYVYTKLETKTVGEKRDKVADLATKLSQYATTGLEKPIRVGAGEKLGTIGAAPVDGAMAGEGAFLHLEVFAAEQLMTGDGWTLVDAGDAAKAADRKAMVAAMLDKKLLAAYHDQVLLDADLQADGTDPDQWALRSVALKMASGWSVDWKAALKSAAPFSFLEYSARDKLGDDFNKYTWWTDAKASNLLPGSETVFHFHPIAFLVQLAWG